MAASILLIFVGGITTLLSLQLPMGTLRIPGSGFFPFLLGLLLMGLAACQTFLHWRRAGAGAEPPDGGRAAGSGRQVLTFMGIIVFATAALELLGFPLMAFLLMLALLRLLGVRRWRDSVLISTLTAGASYMLFVRWLQIPMPKGWPGL